MKQKLKQMKRRWRKLRKEDRWVYIVWSIFILLNAGYMIVRPSIVTLCTLLWLSLVIFVKQTEYTRGRCYGIMLYEEGRYRMVPLIKKLCRTIHRLNDDYAQLLRSYKALYKSYKKLECDYHRLKKQAKRNGKTNR